MIFTIFIFEFYTFLLIKRKNIKKETELRRIEQKHTHARTMIYERDSDGGGEEEEEETPIEKEPQATGFLGRITKKIKYWNSCLSNGMKILKENKTNIRNIGIFVGSIFALRTLYVKASPLRQKITK